MQYLEGSGTSVLYIGHTVLKGKLGIIIKNDIFFNSLNIFCTMTNKRTIIPQIITLLHVSTLSYHHQGACNQYLAKLNKYFK
jgi:hypothetical protein